MCKRLALIISALGGIASLGAQAQTEAEDPLVFYVSGQGVYTKIKTGGESFSPSLFQLNAGVEITDGLLDGIGIQGMVAAPINDDTAANVTMEIAQQTGAYLTLSNPDTGPEDLKVSILLGYASTEIETTVPSLGATNKDTFSGFSYGITLKDQVITGKPFYWTLDYTRYFKDDDLRIDGLSLGVTYAF